MDGDGDLDLAVAGGEPIPEVESFATQECGSGNGARTRHTVKEQTGDTSYNFV